MSIPWNVQSYNDKFAAAARPLVSSELGGIEQIVIIPVLAEKSSLLATLSSLGRNADAELRRTLILCVVNNRCRPLTSLKDIGDNHDTIRYLQALVWGQPDYIPLDEEAAAYFSNLQRMPLRLAYIDAATTGWEMPAKAGGVGTARKIGMDAALSLFDYRLAGEKLLICLDADTLVAGNYLAAIRDYFHQEQAAAAVVNYVHQIPDHHACRLAILNYDVFLRYYVLGLHYAGSPYAFHSLGSTMICTVNGYIAVGGMNKREAAEDFYFLNKLAKYDKIGRVTATTVYPSARLSRRVPFGTGRRVARFLEGQEKEWRLYDPHIFAVIKKWLQVMETAPERSEEEIMTAARIIDPLLELFLKHNNFSSTWASVRKNVKQPGGLRRHFHCWFDGFKTMKLVHFLTEHGFPQIKMFHALEIILKMTREKNNVPGHNGTLSCLYSP